MQTSPVTWSAKWIASTYRGGPRTAAPAPYFRTSFKIDGGIKSAVLHITALGLYECEINGKIVGDHVFAPGWTAYPKRVYFQTYDVTSLLARGENGIGVVLGDGWYCGYIAWLSRQIYGERPQLLAQLEITTEEGAVQRIVTDSSWKITVGPILESDMLQGETYDARRELGAWSSGKFDDSNWLPVVVADDPKIAIERSPGPPVRRHETFAVKYADAIQVKNRPNARIYDFGQNLTGRVRITVKGKAGTQLILRHAEILDADGAIYTENLRSAKATDSYILKGEGTEVWEPRFTFHGFRYAEIQRDGSEEGFALEKAEAIVLHSDTPRTGTFRCSHPLLNQLAHNILWSQKSNFLEVPTDCPQRNERLGWTGDAQVFIRTAAFNMDIRAFFHKWLRDMRDAQSSDGAIPSFIPNPNNANSNVTPASDGGPAWSDAGLTCPWTIYRCYGDLDILRDNYALMEGYMNYLARNRVKDFIRGHPELKVPAGYGDWLALDGSGKMTGGTAHDLIGTAYYAHDADIMARTAELLGKKDDAKKYRELHGKISAAFANRYATPGGLVAAATQTAYVLALHFNLVPEKARAAAAAELVRNIEANGMHLATGFVGTPYLLHVLEVTGYVDVAYKLLEQETFPSWLLPVKNGATTIWERWDGWTPDKGFGPKSMNSFNHYAYGAVGDWMVSTVAGLEIGAPGYKEILFKPRPGGTITSAEARLKTPQGEAGISWKLNGKALDLRLTVPEGSEATLSLPQGWTASSTSFNPGIHEVTAKS